MQFDNADIKLTQQQLDALFDGRIVGAVAGDKFLDNGLQYHGRQLQMGNAHGVILLSNAKSIDATGRIKYRSDSGRARPVV